MAGKPKAPFFVAVALVIVGLVVFAVYRADIVAPKGDQGKGGTTKAIDPIPDRNWGRRPRTRRTPPR